MILDGFVPFREYRVVTPDHGSHGWTKDYQQALVTAMMYAYANDRPEIQSRWTWEGDD